jgi:hypothetical protein
MDCEKIMRLCGEKGMTEELRQVLQLGEDSEAAADLLCLLGLPHLAERNNSDLPFSIDAHFHAKGQEDFLRVVELRNLEYDRMSAHIAKWVERLSRTPALACFSRKAGVRYQDPLQGVLTVQVRCEDAKYSLLFGCEGSSRKDATLEVWERGILLCRTPCAAAAERPFKGLEAGTAVTVRFGESKVGVEILLDEREFSPAEWTGALAAACLQGDLGAALSLLERNGGELSAAERMASRFRAFLTGLASVTKVEGFVLGPLPVFRSSNPSSVVGEDCLTPVREGIAVCWGDDPEGGGEAAASLKQACLKEQPASAKPVVQSPDQADPRVSQGWASHDGWRRLAAQDFEEAARAFQSVQPDTEDPFALNLSAPLACHLSDFKKSKGDPLAQIEKTAQFWESVFGQFAS